jgi:hypothetical protein
MIKETITLLTGAGIALLSLGIQYVLSRSETRKAERRRVMLGLQGARLGVWVVQQRLLTNEILALTAERKSNKCPDAYSREDFKYYRNVADKYKLQVTGAMKDFHSLLVETDAVFKDVEVSDLCSSILRLDIPLIEGLPEDINTEENIKLWIDNQTKAVLDKLNNNLKKLDELNKKIRDINNKSIPIPMQHENTRIEDFIKGILFTLKSTFKD